MRAGSVRSLSLGDREKYHTDGSDDVNSAFMTPIPTNGNPTEVLANRFGGGVYFVNVQVTDILLTGIYSVAQAPEGPDPLF